ncbi:DUF342 domain-containing protein [Anaeromicropila populeti]|uniref:Flagellar Assembly Protein A N-terminal region domain-containing protein n=1 Tax=Anaeromicropila populeti TaxID=37658 RepID=A0A1I6KXR6_9FIRM|nr:FapA family protein [Anaeromicropila populeti]SFR95977.1 hypothetical protein SAMN05661086_02855 [Anaeromicropila populeti]
MNYRNGFFQLQNKDDGTYLKLFPAMAGGEPVTADEIKKYLEDNYVKEYDLPVLLEALRKSHGVTEVKISNEDVWPIHEKIKVQISQDKMTAAISFYPPSSKGKFLDYSGVIEELNKQGITNGIIKENIEAYLRNRRFCTPILAAKGLEPREGKDAAIEYFFSVERTSKPKINEDGSVDFHCLDNISRVQKNAVLAKLTPEDAGAPGKDIYGNKIMPKKVKKLILRVGKNSHLSEDGLVLYSDVDGHVTLVEDKVFVSNLYEVPADVNASTGDIDYEGSVKVKGNVRTGYTIKAKGDIIVDGVVEGATLIADGDIILKRGIQGMSRGSLIAKGNIVTKFIENSEVRSGANISTEAIMHSIVTAKDEIIVSGKRGLVTGGELKAGSSINIKIAGSTMGTSTLLEVGIDPELRETSSNLEARIQKIKEELVTLEQTFNVFKKKIVCGEHLPADKINFIKAIPKTKAALEKELNQCYEEHMEIKDELDQFDRGNIVITNMAYPGVKITIANAVHYVKTEEHHCRYILEMGEVKTFLI